jgi:hypothetical protein
MNSLIVAEGHTSFKDPVLDSLLICTSCLPRPSLIKHLLAGYGVEIYNRPTTRKGVTIECRRKRLCSCKYIAPSNPFLRISVCCYHQMGRDDDNIPSETKPRSTENVGNRIHTHSKIGVQANRFQYSFASDILAVRKPTNGSMVAVNSEMFLPVLMSNVAHGILLLDQLEEEDETTCQLLKWLPSNTMARKGAEKGLTSFFPRYQLHP